MPDRPAVFDRADVLFLEESDLLLLFGSRELRTALFALFTGHVQPIFFYKKDRILAFTRSVMASAAKRPEPRSGLVSDGEIDASCLLSAQIKGI